MIFNKDIKRWAAVRMRPIGDGRQLYFPFDCRNGGQGYFVSEEQGQQLKYAEWSPFNFVLVPLLFCLAVGGLITGFKPHGLLLGGAIGMLLGYLLYTARKKMFDKLTTELPKAPCVLSEERCWKEYAAQVNGFWVWGSVLFWVMLTFSVLVSIVTGLSNIVQSGQLLAVHAAAVVLVLHYTHKVPRLLKYYRLSRKEKTVAGSLEGFIAAP